MSFESDTATAIVDARKHFDSVLTREIEALHADLKGLPPILIQVGTHETLLDDSTRLAQVARDAGVDVSIEKAEGMFHVWHAFAPMLPEGQEAIDRLGAYIRSRTSGVS